MDTARVRRFERWERQSSFGCMHTTSITMIAFGCRSLFSCKSTRDCTPRYEDSQFSQVPKRTLYDVYFIQNWIGFLLVPYAILRRIPFGLSLSRQRLQNKADYKGLTKDCHVWYPSEVNRQETRKKNIKSNFDEEYIGGDFKPKKQRQHWWSSFFFVSTVHYLARVPRRDTR